MSYNQPLLKQEIAVVSSANEFGLYRRPRKRRRYPDLRLSTFDPGCGRSPFPTASRASLPATNANHLTTNQPTTCIQPLSALPTKNPKREAPPLPGPSSSAPAGSRLPLSALPTEP